MFNRPDGLYFIGETMSDHLPTLASLGRLRRDAPKTIAGFRRWRSIIDTDGAVPAKVCPRRPCPDHGSIPSRQSDMGGT